ncbi:uncharacterized protein LOC122011673 [Zingiber officinale]|uniref:uncharacterized protein LOC122011673 n=1 Tax=Zingiber officinale TaxID=94328 RepID=UPI001C4DB2DD|nr:uncharacterized protein LOC122011673 [Zingiber officinale]
MRPRQNRCIGGLAEGPSHRAGASQSKVEQVFKLISARYLNTEFFTTFCKNVTDIIDFYGLHKLVYCSQSINVDLCKEFYSNLRSTNVEDAYTTRVGSKDFEFTHAMLREYLGCKKSKNTFVCFPTFSEPLPKPFDRVTVDSMYNYYYHGHEPSSHTNFSVLDLSAPDNVLYKVVVACLLPIVTKGQAKIRLPHLFMMYALDHKMDIDISLHIFKSIVHYSVPMHGKIYIPFGNAITAFLAYMSIDISQGTLQPLSKDYDQIGARQLALAGIIVKNQVIVWKQGRQRAKEHEEEDQSANEHKEEDEGEKASPVPPSSCLPFNVSDRLAFIEERMNLLITRFDKFLHDFDDFRQQFGHYSQRQDQIYDML